MAILCVTSNPAEGKWSLRAAQVDAMVANVKAKLDVSRNQSPVFKWPATTVGIARLHPKCTLSFLGWGCMVVITVLKRSRLDRFIFLSYTDISFRYEMQNVFMLIYLFLYTRLRHIYLFVYTFPLRQEIPSVPGLRAFRSASAPSGPPGPPAHPRARGSRRGRRGSASGCSSWPKRAEKRERRERKERERSRRGEENEKEKEKEKRRKKKEGRRKKRGEKAEEFKERCSKGEIKEICSKGGARWTQHNLATGKNIEQSRDLQTSDKKGSSQTRPDCTNRLSASSQCRSCRASPEALRLPTRRRGNVTLSSCLSMERKAHRRGAPDSRAWTLWLGPWRLAVNDPVSKSRLSAQRDALARCHTFDAKPGPTRIVCVGLLCREAVTGIERCGGEAGADHSQLAELAEF